MTTSNRTRRRAEETMQGEMQQTRRKGEETIRSIQITTRSPLLSIIIERGSWTAGELVREIVWLSWARPVRMQEQVRSHYFAGRSTRALCLPIDASLLPVANHPLRLSQESLLYRRLAEATSRVAGARASLGHDDGTLGCVTLIARARIARSLFRWHRDGYSVAAKAAVSGTAGNSTG